MTTRCGYVSIVGRPNVGKSTLLNCILKQKLSITSRKAQTTRFQIYGIDSTEDTQIIYVDTPGMHQHEGGSLNKQLNDAALNSLSAVDAVFFVIAANKWTDQEDWIAKRLSYAEVPIILVINKIDLMPKKHELLPFIDKVSKYLDFEKIIPICAQSGDNVDLLQDTVRPLMPEFPFFYPTDILTDRSERFVAAELIREKIVRYLGKELPYATHTAIETFNEKENCLCIDAVIWVEREGQKRIIIGNKGKKLKEIATEARLELERFFDSKVYLQLWVRVKKDWSNNLQLDLVR